MLVDPRFEPLLRRFTPTTVFMHVGAANCDLAILAASFVDRVYVVDPASIPERDYLTTKAARLAAVDSR